MRTSAELQYSMELGVCDAQDWVEWGIDLGCDMEPAHQQVNRLSMSFSRFTELEEFSPDYVSLPVMLAKSKTQSPHIAKE